MSLLLETIKIENGQIRNLEWHNKRFNASRKALLGISEYIDLESVIKVPDDLGNGIYRCRLLYGREIEEVQFHPHLYRTVRSLKMIQCNDIEYEYKFADRRKFEYLYELRESCDEILIIKNGFITDTSISNVVFSLSDGWWLTPHRPLLKGTMRAYLLETGQIAEAVLGVEDLPLLTGARMINCMMDLESGPVIEMDQIVF